MPIKLSIITVVDNSFNNLHTLSENIKPILENDQIEWVIKDSGRCKKTLRWGNKNKNKNLIFISSKDSGIYDALNLAIIESKGLYYLVVGSDDLLIKENIFKLLEKIDLFINYEVISFPVMTTNGLIRVNKYIPTFINIRSLISSHSVGTLIKKNVHFKYGFYKPHYKILADSYFISLIKKNKILQLEYMYLGTFSLNGVSSKKNIVIIFEAFKYHIDLGHNFLLQCLILIVRFLLLIVRFLRFKIKY